MATSRRELEDVAYRLAEQTRLLVAWVRPDRSVVMDDVCEEATKLVQRVEAICQEWRTEQIPDDQLPDPLTLRGILADNESTDN